MILIVICHKSKGSQFALRIANSVKIVSENAWAQVITITIACLDILRVIRSREFTQRNINSAYIF